MLGRNAEKVMCWVAVVLEEESAAKDDEDQTAVDQTKGLHQYDYCCIGMDCLHLAEWVWSWPI